MSPRLPRVNGSDVERALRRVGWQEIRHTGAHIHLVHPAHPGKLVTVSVHRGKIVPQGTLKAILASAGLTADELRDLL
ncbi:MAG: type II toxin-antitoxin system HicA family toxin [Chloroflexi bacterium]|nr:type II toxin-antitoxin system HicA family toxin [Chloroflexota bacterium]